MANSKTKLFKTTNLKKSAVGVSLFNYMFDNYFAFDYYVMRHFTEHMYAHTLATLIYSHNLRKKRI